MIARANPPNQGPSYTLVRDKPFTITFLRGARLQSLWNHILTQNRGEGWVSLRSDLERKSLRGRCIGTSVLAGVALPGGTDMPLSATGRSDNM